MIAGHEVTPSDAVDQAWHLHLTYSRDYWQVFCPKVLGGRPASRPHRWRRETHAIAIIASMPPPWPHTRPSFGEPPPGDIWPEAHKAFLPSIRKVRALNFFDVIVRKRRVALALGPLAFGGRLARGKDNVMQLFSSWTGGEFLLFYAVLLAMAVAASWVDPALICARPGGATKSLDSESLALLAGGPQRHADSVIADLYAQGGLADAGDGKLSVVNSAISCKRCGQGRCWRSKVHSRSMRLVPRLRFMPNG